MKPISFEYVAARSVSDALDVLGAEDARILAGGQSLVPLMNLRLARPSVLVDVNNVPDLGSIVIGERVEIGALCRHRQLELDPAISEQAPLLAKAAALIGHPPIRNRGTLGGSIAHGDPVAELPAALVALDATIVVTARAGDREIPAAEFFTGIFSTALESDEFLMSVRVPRRVDGETAAFVEIAPRHGDFAVAGIAARMFREPNGTCGAVRLVGCGFGSTPVDLSAAASDVNGVTDLSEPLLRQVARAAAAAVEPSSDIHASAEDRRELAQILAVAALREAWGAGSEGVAA